MNLTEAIREHALPQAEAGDWDAVSKILSTPSIKVRIGKVGGKATLSALVAAGIDPNKVIAAMRSVPMSSELLDTLTVSGVDWDDDLTKYVMGGLVTAGKIDQQVVSIVQGLSARMDSPTGREVTAEECKTAWLSAALQRQWASLMNETIMPATSSRSLLVKSLRTAADMLEAG